MDAQLGKITGWMKECYRWAKKALVTSLESSDVHMLVSMMRDGDSQDVYRVLNNSIFSIF